MKKIGLFVLFAALLSTGMLFGAEVVVQSQPLEPTGWAHGILKSVLGLDTFWELIQFLGAAAITAIAGVVSKRWADDKVKQDALEALRLGVVQTYNEEIQAGRAALQPDGSISPEEGARLRKISIENAKRLATGPAYDFLAATALPVLNAWVQRIVNREKNGG